MDAFFQFTKLSTFQCIPISLSFSVFSFFFFVYQSFLSTYKDIIGKLSIHHIMFFAYGSSKRKWKPFFTVQLSSIQEKKEKSFLLPLAAALCQCSQKYENEMKSIMPPHAKRKNIDLASVVKNEGPSKAKLIF